MHLCYCVRFSAVPLSFNRSCCTARVRLNLNQCMFSIAFLSREQFPLYRRPLRRGGSDCARGDSRRLPGRADSSGVRLHCLRKL